MVVEGQRLIYKNVISCGYEYMAEDFDKSIENFQQIIESQNLTPNGPFFFSVVSKPTDEPIVSMFYMPIKEARLVDLTSGELNFQTYFVVDDLVMTRFKSIGNENVIQQSSDKIIELIDYTNENKMELTSPLFTMLKSINEELYVELYIGATRIFHSETLFKRFLNRFKK